VVTTYNVQKLPWILKEKSTSICKQLFLFFVNKWTLYSIRKQLFLFFVNKWTLYSICKQILTIPIVDQVVFWCKVRALYSMAR
jgi:hypothetical protein